MKDTILKTLLSLDATLIILFGSFAKGQQNSSSDLDIAFLSKQDISNVDRWQVAQELAIKLNIDVDLIDLSKANDVLRFEIVSTGDIILNDSKDEFLDRCYTNYLRLNDDREEVLKHYGR
jgi:predicted nucleotidyltransferase